MDFDRWFAKQGQSAKDGQMLPDGVWEDGPGHYVARCCCCDKWTEIYCDLEEIPEVGYEHYCGGSPMCCP